MRAVRILLSGIALLIGSAAVRSQPPAKALEAKDIDQIVNNTLRDVINAGAKLYNRPNNDHAGCYRLFEGSLMTLKPMLGHRPTLQKAVDDAFAAAEREQSVTERAFILRSALDRIREETSTLWQRLGGEKGVRKAIDDFVALAATNPKVDFTRGGKFKLTDAQVADLKQKLVELVSQAAGGPLKYTGKPMKEVHKGMAITDAQFAAIADDLKQALDKNGVKAADRDAVLAVVETTRKDIVEVPAPKKEEKPSPKQEDGKIGADSSLVRGRVTYNGNAVVAGTITLVSTKDKDAKPLSGPIGEDGTYILKNVPLGEYAVKVEPPPGEEKAKGAVPAKYGSEKTTPLKVTHKGGRHTYNVELSD
jgi:hemoglobin